MEFVKIKNTLSQAGKKLEKFVKHGYTLYILKLKLKLGLASWHNLKKYSKFAKQDNDHFFYEETVKNICGLANFPKLLHASFVGKGRGLNVLNSYRKVKMENGFCYFEKIYKKKSDDLVKVNFFYNSVYCYISENFIVPNALFLEGKQGVLVYFDWVKMGRPLSKNELLEFYSDFRDTALKVNLPSDVTSGFLEDFRREPSYFQSLNKSKSWLKNHATGTIEILNIIEVFLRKLPLEEKVFTHGDLVPANCAYKRTVIDFDRCGVYPKSYELAYLLSRSFYFSNLSELDSKVGSLIKSFSNYNQLGFYFFAFVFYSARKNIQVSDEFLLSLWTRLNYEADNILITN